MNIRRAAIEPPHRGGGAVNARLSGRAKQEAPRLLASEDSLNERGAAIPSNCTGRAGRAPEWSTRPIEVQDAGSLDPGCACRLILCEGITRAM
jgi:hypothetical protein